jgi:hypothetical protein
MYLHISIFVSIKNYPKIDEYFLLWKFLTFSVQTTVRFPSQVFNSTSLALEVNFAPSCEHWILRGNVQPFVHPQGWTFSIAHTYIKRRGEQKVFALGRPVDNLTSSGQSSPLGSNLSPGVTFRSYGHNWKPATEFFQELHIVWKVRILLEKQPLDKEANFRGWFLRRVIRSSSARHPLVIRLSSAHHRVTLW